MTPGGIPLNVVPANVRAVGRVAYGIAEQLRSGSASLDGEVQGLFASWKGSAADAYRAGWDDMHDGAVTVWNSLFAVAEKLGVDAAEYQAQDDSTVSSLHSLRMD